MKYTVNSYKLIQKTELAKGIFDFCIYCPEIAETAVCGQFINVKAEGFFLRRPISICGIDRRNGTLRIVFEVRGKGTLALSKFDTGDMMDITGPLGGGHFTMLSPDKKAVIVGGGIGNPPLVPLALHYGKNATVISGFRNESVVILQSDFAKNGADVILCTDDGSAGRKGFVTDALAERLDAGECDIIYACGPMVMLERIAKAAKLHGIPCEISLEERMGCGVGGCLVCACRISKNGSEEYLHVCKDGPVFNANEVIFND